MNLKKNVFSHLMWFIYSALVCVGLMGISVVLTNRVGYSKAEGFMMCGLWLLACAWVVYFRKKQSENDEEDQKHSRLPAVVVEGFFVILLFVFGIFLRVQGLVNIGEPNAYHEFALVAEGKTIPTIVHGAVYFYLKLLHFVYLLFGNKLVAGIWLQIVLLLIAGVFLYFTVRRMAGAVSAVIMLAFLMMGSCMMQESLVLSPQLFFFVVYAVALYLCTLCMVGGKQPLTCALTGLMLAFVCYLDIMGVTLLFFLVCGLLMGKSEEPEPLTARLLGGLSALVGCVVGFVVFIIMDAIGSGKAIVNVLGAWWELYAPSAFAIPESLTISEINAEMVILLLLLPIGVAGYWFKRESEKQSVWILTTLVLLLMAAFGMTTEEMDGSIQFTLMFAVLAGVSLSGVFSFGEDRPLVLAIPVSHKVHKVHTEEYEDSDLPEEEFYAEPEESTQQTPKVTLLENPLPLPKAHVKKTLDYDIVDIHPTLNCFDIRVAANDDYDI